MISTTPVRLWSRARQRLVETDHISFLSSKQSSLLRRRTKRNDRNWRSCRNNRKKKRKTKETTKTKEREDEMSRKCRFHSKFGLWYKLVIFPSKIIERRGGHMETHRSLKTECLGSILGGRQFFIFISSVIYIFPIFIILVTAGPQGQRSKIIMLSFVPFFCSHYP